MTDFGRGFVLGLIVAGGLALGLWETIYLPLPFNLMGGFGLACMTLALLAIIVRTTQNTESAPETA